MKRHRLYALALLLCSPLSNHANEQVGIQRVQFEGEFPATLADCLQQRAAQRVPADFGSLELYELQLDLTQACLRQQGYSTATLQFPDQDLRDGSLLFQLQLDHFHSLRDDSEPSVLPKRRLAQHWAHLRGRPLQLPHLRQWLMTLENEALIQALHAQISPLESDSAAIGSTALILNLIPAARWQARIQLDNHRPASLGEFGASAHYAHRSISGRADQLDMQVHLGAGLNGLGADYRLPVLRDWWLQLRSEYRETSVVESPFDEVDIETRLLDAKLAALARWNPQSNVEWAFDFGLRYRRAQSSLLNQPFSFSLGPRNGRSALTALSLRGQWSRGWFNGPQARGQIATSAELHAGLPWFAATENGDEAPDGDFLRAQLQLTALYWLAGSTRNYLRLEARGQWADHALLSIEQFSLGGHAGVRGYRENAVVRDTGWVTSVSIGRVLARDGRGRSRWKIAAFADYGEGHDRGRLGQAGQEDALASLGLELSWHPNKAWQLQLQAASAQKQRFNAHSSLQDEGVHVRVAYAWNAS